ncbi:cytochrome b/b6 domain-containing protein [Rhodobaculum claviforme]|uniref:Cytochrome n=1 Tax=Rhodobaculum claviforme TaxID=1549854 RepID=A0A934WJN8_9RHOB|nr:cytochrome b/b6 domain-containing protein [Rhodobaculum claviforme]MBK5928049.1 cytochrome [Rhodobaculum claviforme]
MALANTHHSYGSAARVLHWMTALVILTAFPLGLIANAWPWETSDQFAVKATLFSLHKTVGLMAFTLAVVRITWAVVQPHPAPIHPERRWETALAGVVHWMLYLSLLIVPLSGWVHHAATTGFAPIWWPFGQSLPFVPVDDGVASASAAMHWLFTKVLAASLVLHVAGAIKHHALDRDATLVRMWRGTPAGGDRAAHGWAPAGIAVVLYGMATAAALALVPTDTARPTLGAGTGNWQVTEGTLAIEVRQMGSAIEGSFGQWTADIDYDPDTRSGTVQVTIDIESLRLGSVTAQAMGADFFAADDHPTAVFAADIGDRDGDLVADGTLTLRGTEAPVTLPFVLRIDGDRAVMEGQTTLDRRDFAIGMGQTDPATLGFDVAVRIALEAERE